MSTMLWSGAIVHTHIVRRVFANEINDIEVVAHTCVITQKCVSAVT